MKYSPPENHKILLNETSWRSIIDTTGGRSCYTLSHLPKRSGKSISYFRFDLKSSVNLYIHSPGSFKSKRRQSIYFNKTKNDVYVTLRYEIFKILNTKERPCNNDPDYVIDECFEDLTYKESMANFNCTWPFLNIKDNICIDKTLAKDARKIGLKYRFAKDNRCPESCSSIDATVIAKTNPTNNGEIRIMFPGQVKVIQSYYVYDGISLVAEIGGYVGLFLGYSIKQITELFDVVFNAIKRKHF